MRCYVGDIVVMVVVVDWWLICGGNWYGCLGIDVVCCMSLLM